MLESTKLTQRAGCIAVTRHATSAHAAPRGTVAVSMLRALLDHLRALDANPDSLAASVGLDRELLAHPQRSVDARTYEHLMQAGIAALHNPLLGLEFGMAARPDRWGTLGFLLRHCATLGEAIAYQARFAHLINAVGEGRLVAYARHVAIEWHGRGATMPALVEEAFAAWVGFARWASARETSPLAVTFAHRAQGDPAVYAAFFDCPVSFSAPASRLCFDPALLDMPLRSPDAGLTAHLRTQIAARADAADTQAARQRLQTWLGDCIQAGLTPTLAGAARALELSQRTLQHRLQAHDTTFRRCVDDARRGLALDLLRHSGLSIGDISHRVGFSEQSAFQRAFKRWYATTPLAWRRQR